MIRKPKDLPAMVKVRSSSNVQEYGYDSKTRMLFIRFIDKANPLRKGPLYRYHDIEPGMRRRFSLARSKGSFVWKYIRKMRCDKWNGTKWLKRT